MTSSIISNAFQYFSTGSVNPRPLIPLPAIPTIVAEWSSLLPLVCHLASYKYEYEIVGELALSGQLHVPLFPRLGVLLGIARLLSNNSNFLDEASSKGGTAEAVYDVNWGSVFPCANGAASRTVAHYAISRAGSLICLPDSVSTHNTSLTRGITDSSARPRDGELSSSSSPGVSDHSQLKPLPGTAPNFRRYQTLHVFHLSRHCNLEKRAAWFKYVFLYTMDRATLFLLLALIIALVLIGGYGTAIIVFISLLTRGLCSIAKLKIQRPPGFLNNNETGEGCMLASIHQNANVWHLYTGDRGIIDTLLNKTMITIAGRTNLLSTWFYVAHVAQLLAMTYVAAQKGFDGIFLLFLMVLTWALEWIRGGNALARQWLRREKVSVVARSFRFTGRMALIAAVQMSSQTTESAWMDTILAKCPRREAWLECIASTQTEISAKLVESNEKFILSGVDQSWLEMNVGLAYEGHMTVAKELREAIFRHLPPV